MDLNKLEAFMTVAKYKNFTKAADKLFISQPALSKKIADFEKELNATLLIRGNRNVELTQAGNTLYIKAPFFLDALHNLEKEVQQISSEPVSRLSIACTGVEYGRFTPFIHKFQDEYPDIEINLRWCSSKEAKELVFSNVFDFAFQLHMDLEEVPFIDHRPFYYDFMDVILHNYHPLANVSEISFEELKTEKLIGIKSKENHAPFNYLVDSFKDSGIRFDRGISSVDSIDSLVLNVSAGCGIGFLNHSMKKMYGQMVSFVPLQGEKFRCLETDIIWNKTNQNPTIPVFLDFLDEDNEEINLEQYKQKASWNTEDV